MKADIDAIVRNNAPILQAVGAMVIAGGHVEVSLAHLLLGLKETGGPMTSQKRRAILSRSWAELDKDIDKLLTSQAYPNAATIGEVLAWGRAHNLKVLRHNAAHAMWMLDGNAMVGNRYFQDKAKGTIVGSPEEFLAIAAVGFEYARRIQTVIPIGAAISTLQAHYFKPEQA